MAEGSLPINSTTYHDESRWGWVQSGDDRGTLDILWSCCVTITLCCWVATHPNAGSPKDKWFHPMIDKFHLAVIGLLGPDFLFGIAVGQFSSARSSVRKFRSERKDLCNGTKWTYKYAFFTDMGGMFLTGPDFPEGFPINCEQLHWLVKHGHLDFPDMEKMNIDERNASDTLSRVITVWQALWFSVIEIQRAIKGLPMSTLELTALSYVFVMLATQICWLRKPSISCPRMITTKDNREVGEIRRWAKNNTHPDLPETWYRTPLDFLNGPRWRIDTHWSYYTRLTHLMWMPIISRPMTSKPWDRIPSDMWIAAEKSWTVAPFAGLVLLVFSGWFLLGWNFFFATAVEQYMWRVCAIYHVVFGVIGGVYYMIEGFRWHAAQERLRETGLKRASPLKQVTSGTTTATKVMSTESTLLVSSGGADIESQVSSGSDSQPLWARRWRRLLPRRVLVYFDYVVRTHRKIDKLADGMRNISVDQDPEMALPLLIILPITILCAIYTACRGYFYIEDFLSLRVQPAGVYVTVNRYVPFWGDG